MPSNPTVLHLQWTPATFLNLRVIYTIKVTCNLRIPSLSIHTVVASESWRPYARSFSSFHFREIFVPNFLVGHWAEKIGNLENRLFLCVTNSSTEPHRLVGSVYLCDITNYARQLRSHFSQTWQVPTPRSEWSKQTLSTPPFADDAEVFT